MRYRTTVFYEGDITLSSWQEAETPEQAIELARASAPAIGTVLGVALAEEEQKTYAICLTLVGGGQITYRRQAASAETALEQLQSGFTKEFEAMIQNIETKQVG